MQVKDIMTHAVVCVEVPGTRADVMRRIGESGHFGFPVVKKGGRQLVGMVTKRDLMKHPEENQVALLMTRDPLTVEPDASLRHAAELMGGKGVRRIPVAQTGELVGIITLADMIQKALVGLNLATPVKGYIRREAFTTWERTPIRVVFQIMSLADVRALPIVNDFGKLSGIVTDADLIKVAEVTTREEASDMKASTESDWDWSSSAVLLISKGELSFPDAPVVDVMTKEVATSNELTPVSECARKMKRYDIDQMPIVDAHGELAGIVYDTTLLLALIDALPKN